MIVLLIVSMPQPEWIHIDIQIKIMQHCGHGCLATYWRRVTSALSGAMDLNWPYGFPS